jgi:hypothetical protein
MFLPEAFRLPLLNSDSLMIAPVERRIKSTFKRCINMHSVVAGILELRKGPVSD